MKCYLSKGIYSVVPNLPDIPFQNAFHLRDGFYIQFPVKINKDLKTAIVNDNKQKQSIIKTFSNFTYHISIPSSGIIPYPFFIHSIKGNGIVSFDEKKYYNIGSNELDEKINKWDNFLFPIFFQSYDSISVNYILNTIRFNLKKENELTIKGKNLDKLEILLVKN
jgi:hypothetical protein